MGLGVVSAQSQFFQTCFFAEASPKPIKTAARLFFPNDHGIS
jgi:hypothetical protein